MHPVDRFDEIFLSYLSVSSAVIPRVTFCFMKGSGNMIVVNCSHDFCFLVDNLFILFFKYSILNY